MYLTIPYSSADAMWVPVWSEASARIAVSCARMMVSKLNVNQFQAVNSPLVEPVSTRRLSGIQYVATSGGEKKTDDTSAKMTNRDRIDGDLGARMRVAVEVVYHHDFFILRH